MLCGWLIEVMKRIFDFCVSLCLMIVLMPVFALCYIAVWCEDRCNPIFKQERIGLGGRPFDICKFRSMRVNAEVEGPQLYDKANDARLTRVGRFLRTTHLDELPQLWNVLKGDMSFVGPRPERQFYIDQIMQHDPRYAELYRVRPGVTSYATIYNGYTDSMEKMLKRLEYDLEYVNNHSLWLDLKLMWTTFYKIVAGKKI